MKRREKRECSFSDLPDYQQERFGECDKYASDYTVFNVLGIEVWVENDKLSEALKALTEKKRNIILLSYFMDMADGEISHFINLPRSNVQYHRRCWNMNKTKIRATEQPIAVDIEGLTAMLSCGRATARKIGEQAGAKIVIGRRVLYSIEKVKNYLLYLEE